MSPINELVTGNQIENFENAVDEIPQGLHEYTMTDAMPMARNGANLLSHKYPDLQEVLNQNELQSDLSELSLQASFEEARDNCIKYLAEKYKDVPLEMLVAITETPAGSKNFLLEGALRNAFI